jgi:hypothetical protein
LSLLDGESIFGAFSNHVELELCNRRHLRKEKAPYRRRGIKLDIQAKKAPTLPLGISGDLQATEGVSE